MWQKSLSFECSMQTNISLYDNFYQLFHQIKYSHRFGKNQSLMTIPALLLAIIFFMLSGIHFSWALGGTWGFETALPTTEDGKRVLNPKKIDSAIVGAGLLFFGMFYLIKTDHISLGLPEWVLVVAGWLIPSIFLLRAIGDFKYVGFFKKVSTTDFAKNDSRFFSPLCAGIALVGFILELI
ncbi:DUF3995 domain-containing protein [Ekhidna sp.]|uniref:DUF3995 domain-containing protein n=1 Tax=Ekhidna sp. TaxID=2608089 RepID=UPI003B5A9CA9